MTKAELDFMLQQFDETVRAPRFFGIRDEIKESLRRYIQGVPPGGFLKAVLENNLKEAVGRADDYNRSWLPQIVDLCYNGIPGSSWGSPEEVNEWLNIGEAV